MILGRVRKYAFVANAELVQEALERPGELASTIGASDTNLELRRGDVRVDDVTKHRWGVAVAPTEAKLLQRMELSTHNTVYLLPERDVAWMGPVMSMNSLPARLLARLSVTFGTAYRRILVSEHSAHGTHLLITLTPATLSVP